MSRAEVKALLQKVNGTPLKWKSANKEGGNIVIDVFVLANLKSGIVVKPLDPDELKAKNKASCLEYAFDDPRYCLAYSKFSLGDKGYDGNDVEQRDIDSIVTFAENILKHDVTLPTNFNELNSTFKGMALGSPACPMF